MFIDDAFDYRHTCTNPVFLVKHQGRPVVLVEIAYKGRKAPRAKFRAMLLPWEFDLVDQLFPGERWILNHGYVAFNTTARNGKRIKPDVARVLDFLAQQREREAGGATRPTTKGVVIECGPEGRLDLTPENRIRASGKDRRAHTSWETGAAIIDRQKLLASGQGLPTPRPQRPRSRSSSKGETR